MKNNGFWPEFYIRISNPSLCNFVVLIYSIPEKKKWREMGTDQWEKHIAEFQWQVWSWLLLVWFQRFEIIQPPLFYCLNLRKSYCRVMGHKLLILFSLKKQNKTKTKSHQHRTGDAVWLVEYFSSTHEMLGSLHSTTVLGSQVQSYPLLHSMFQASLRHMRHYIKNKIKSLLKYMRQISLESFWGSLSSLLEQSLQSFVGVWWLTLVTNLTHLVS